MLQKISAIIEATRPRSAWKKGVKLYAEELLEELTEIVEYAPESLDNARLLEKAMLNGVAGWSQYSLGGCSLIYDRSIAERLCTASELKRTCNGFRKPNAREEWLDTQARALYQAAALILRAYEEVAAE